MSVAEHLRNVLALADSLLHSKHAKHPGQLDSTSNGKHTDPPAMEWNVRTQRSTNIPFIHRLHSLLFGDIPRLWYDPWQHFDLVWGSLWQCGRAETHLCADQLIIDAATVEPSQADPDAHSRLLSIAPTSKCTFSFFSLWIRMIYVFSFSVFTRLSHVHRLHIPANIMDSMGSMQYADVGLHNASASAFNAAHYVRETIVWASGARESSFVDGSARSIWLSLASVGLSGNRGYFRMVRHVDRAFGYLEYNIRT